MKKITNFDFKNKKVILRLDLNVPIKDEKILSKEKINSSLKTINYISNSGGRVIILSHLGKIKEEKDKEKNSLFIVYKEMLKEFNNIYFSSATHGTVLEEKINNDFHKALLDNNLDLAIDILFNLPYLKLRKFIVYLLDMRNLELIKKNNKELVRDKLA